VTARTPARRSQPRWRTAAATICGIVLLLWGADALARIGAQSVAADKIQDATDVAEPSEVHIRGALFFPQLIRGSFSRVDVITLGITGGPVRVDRVDSQLFDVRVRFQDLLVGDVRRVAIGRSVQLITLRYQDLNAYLDATNRPIELGSGTNEQVRVTGSITVAGEPVQASADATLSVDNGQLQITPRQINMRSNVLDQATRLLLAERLRLTMPVGNLPFGHELTSATAYADGIHVTAEGTAIVLQPGQI
jgi:LmeA-like phospholipid-binding